MSKPLDRLLQQVDELEQARNREKAAFKALDEALQRLQAALERLADAQAGGGPRVIH
jgi:hypothetical protein